MSDFTDNEDKMLVQLVSNHECTAAKGTKISWKAIAKKMKSKKHPEQVRLRFRCLKRRFGESAAGFPRRYFLRIVVKKATLPQTKSVEEEDPCVWRQRLQDGYCAIRRDQNANDMLVLGHRHMYGELIPSCLIKIFDIFKTNCGFNSRSVFVDFGCGLGKVVYMAYRSEVQESIGIVSIYFRDLNN